MADDGASRSHIRVVWGTGTGPTALAAYDAALAAANVHDYNLARLSSVVPPDVSVEAVGTAPDLGPVGGRLWVVEARTTVDGPGRASAALGWATGPAGGVFFEAGDAEDEDAAREQVALGLTAAREHRTSELPDGAVRSLSFEVPDGQFGTAVVLAAYGEAEAVF